MLFLCLHTLFSFKNLFPLIWLSKLLTFRKINGNIHISKKKEIGKNAMRKILKMLNLHVKLFHITHNQNENLK